jgi:adenylate cyclase
MSADRRRRTLALLAVAILAAGVGIAFRAFDLLPRLELAAVDGRFDVRGATTPRNDIVIVGIDEKTLRANPKDTYPLDRKRHAAVIRNLSKAGAKVIAIDTQFSEPTSVDSDNALVLASHAAKAHVVLGSDEATATGKTRIFGGDDGLKYSRGTPGATSFPNDSDGRIRRMPFAVSRLRNFGLTAAEKLTGHPIPTPAGGTAWIDFAGPEGTFPQLSFADVERNRFDRAAVRGKLVIVGPTAPSLRDLFATSSSAGMSGPEIEANAAATALDGFPLHENDGWNNWLLAAAVGLVAPLVAMRLGSVLGLLAGLLALIAYLIGLQIAFSHGAILDALPVLAGAAVGLAGTVVVANPVATPWFDRFLSRVAGEGGRTRRLRALLLMTAALLVICAVGVGAATHVLRRADLSTVDMRFKARGTQPSPASVALVAVDETTFDQLPGHPQWPFDRGLHARVLQNLTKAGAKVVAFDIQFTEQDKAKGDNALIEAVHDAPHVVLSTTNVFGGETRLLSWGKGLQYSRGVPGVTIVTNDADGRVRRMQFVSQGLDTFPVAAARLAKPSLTLPPGNSAWIDYPGPPGVVSTLSFSDVYLNRFPASAVKGRVVVVGATAASLQDQHATSTSGNVLAAGPEIQAEAINTALEGFPLRSGPWWLNTLLVLILGALAPLAGIRLRMWLAIGLGGAGVVALLAGAQLAFNSGTVIGVIYPLVAGLLAILATVGIHGVTVAFEKEQARDAFARFVPEAVVDQVLADAGDGVRLGGVRSEATVMFSDLRGFTSFSETLEPERVIEALNRYLTEMSEAILNHGGTLVAYMGDGIMAVFGAPLRQDDHADRALEAAREMLARLQGFNAWLREQQLHDGFKMGIGLNSGPVMSGNVGSERRLEYTALGDTTNTAARLEGMTKGTPHQLYLADTTHQALTRPADDLEPVGEAEVRGRKATVRLWSLREGAAPAAAEEPAAPETIETP